MVISTVESESARKGTAIVIGGCSCRSTVVNIIDDGKIWVGVDTLAVAFFVADASIDLMLFVEVESLPQPAASTLSVDELTRRSKELPEIVK